MIDDKLIVALDVGDVDSATTIVSELGDAVNFYKVGYQLGYSKGGFDFVRLLKDKGKKVFLDLKLLDIENTISQGVRSIAKMNVDMLTIHAYPKTMAAAVAALANETNSSPLKLLGVTVLTSMNDIDLKNAGYNCSAKDLVLLRAKQAFDAGMGGLVASAQEAQDIRKIIGFDMLLVTPGIRPAQTQAHDQARIMTPAAAIKAGASHLVIGRPIIEAANRKKAATDILQQINDLLP